jgi:hypothetical protein
MRAKEAELDGGQGVQLYGGGAGAGGVTAPTMQPAAQVSAAGIPSSGEHRDDGCGDRLRTSAGTSRRDSRRHSRRRHQTQGAQMATSMLPMQSATGASDLAATADPVGNYGNPQWLEPGLRTRHARVYRTSTTGATMTYPDLGSSSYGQTPARRGSSTASASTTSKISTT